MPATGLTATITISPETLAAIDAARLRPTDTVDAILRRYLQLDPPDTTLLPGSPRRARRKGTRRRTGNWTAHVAGERLTADSMIAAYKLALTTLEARVPGFLDRLSTQRTAARRIVARDPSDLYLTSPQLAQIHAERLDTTFWVDTNLSRRQMEVRLRTAARLAGLQAGQGLGIDRTPASL